MIQDKIERIVYLVNELNKCNEAYFNQNYNIVSDREYDKAFSELEQLEKETGFVLSSSPTINVGYEVRSELTPVEHTHPMLSLSKTKSVDDLEAFCSDKDVVFMAKLDGLSISLTYDNGELVRAETRGNGFVGEDVTHNAKVFANLPLKISRKDRIVVDGEAIIDYETFQNINESLPEGKKYKNPRNLVSGSVRQLDSSVTAKRNVKFLAWKFVEGSESDSFYERLLELDVIGFEIVPALTYRKKPPFKIYGDWRLNVNQFISAIKASSENCPIDGVVVCYDSISYGESLGVTAHHPKHSIAFKFYDDGVNTILRDIKWNTTRTGLVNPVAIFNTVEIDGTDVSRASLSNVSIIEELQLGYGDKISVIKANQIIPQVVSNYTNSGTVKIPTVCPSCGELLEVRSDNGRKMLYCSNDKCPAIIIDRFANFAGKKGLDIKGLSEKTIRKLIENESLFRCYLPDLFNISQDEIASLDGFTEKSAGKLVNAINSATNCSLQSALVAIGIPEIGVSTAKIIAEEILRHCNGDKSPLHVFVDMCNTGYKWSEFDGIGTVMEQKINKFVHKHSTEILDLSRYITIKMDAKKKESVLIGKTFCITGELLRFGNRANLTKVIEDMGGKVVSGVTKKTDFLICNSESQSNKCQKAKSLGTPILTEDDFCQYMNSQIKLREVTDE